MVWSHFLPKILGIVTTRGKKNSITSHYSVRSSLREVRLMSHQSDFSIWYLSISDSTIEWIINPLTLHWISWSQSRHGLALSSHGRNGATVSLSSLWSIVYINYRISFFLIEGKKFYLLLLLKNSHILSLSIPLSVSFPDFLPVASPSFAIENNLIIWWSQVWWNAQCVYFVEIFVCFVTCTTFQGTQTVFNRPQTKYGAN